MIREMEFVESTAAGARWTVPAARSVKSFPTPTVSGRVVRDERASYTTARSNQPKLLDRVRLELRVRHYSRRTEEAYVGWIRRFIVFQHLRHPRDMGAPEVSDFLTWLAVRRGVAASTQNQALSALLFLYRHVLQVQLPWLDDIVRAKQPRRLPVVLSRAEVQAVLSQLDGVPRGPAEKPLRHSAGAA